MPASPKRAHARTPSDFLRWPLASAHFCSPSLFILLALFISIVYPLPRTHTQSLALSRSLALALSLSLSVLPPPIVFPTRLSLQLDIIYKIPHAVPISAHHKWNFDDLLSKMWDYLALKRIYTKPKGQLPDYEQPVVLPGAHTKVEDFCNSLSGSFGMSSSSISHTSLPSPL